MLTNLYMGGFEHRSLMFTLVKGVGLYTGVLIPGWTYT